MKKLLSVLLILYISSVSFPQNCDVEYKSIKKKNKEKNYELNITYSQIKGLNTAGEKGFNELIKSICKAQADSFKVWMKDWEKPPNFEAESFYELSDTLLYCDSKIASTLFYEYSYFAGAAHPNNFNFSVNYDLEKNREMKLSDLFTGKYLKKLSEICIEEIAKSKKEYDPNFNEKDDEWLNSGAGPDEKNFKAFNITKDKFIITFPTYQVASYAEGPQTVEIPYSLLEDFINQEGPLKEFLQQ
jgi:hypothetical protein